MILSENDGCVYFMAKKGYAMIRTYEIHDIRFVITKDELGYQEVLDNFSNTSSIYILTYNISQSNNELLNALKNSNDDVGITVISNIPQRWTDYFESVYADKARRTIRIYKNKLDPQKISERAEVYFCFDNHAKIIMTDNIVYVGSSNYSEESANNFESGFISTDSGFIEFLKDEIFPWIIEYSSEYSIDNSLLLYEVALKKSIAMFEELHDEFHFCFYHLNDHRGFETWYYNSTEPRLKISLVERAGELVEKYQELLENIRHVFERPIVRDRGITDIYDEIERLNKISDYVNELFEGDIRDLALFNEQYIIDDYMEDHYAEAYDEYLGKYIDSAMDLARDSFAIESESARESADSLLEQLSSLIAMSKRILEKYRTLPKKELLIDNTR